MATAQQTTTGTTPYSQLPPGTSWVQATTYGMVAGSNAASNNPAQVRYIALISFFLITFRCGL